MEMKRGIFWESCTLAVDLGLHNLIAVEKTGAPKELACLMQISERSIHLLIEQLKDFISDDKTIIIVSHYEKLLKSFEPTTVTVVANGTTSQTTDASVVTKVLSDGFKDFA